MDFGKTTILGVPRWQGSDKGFSLSCRGKMFPTSRLQLDVKPGRVQQGRLKLSFVQLRHDQFKLISLLHNLWRIILKHKDGMIPELQFTPHGPGIADDLVLCLEPEKTNDDQSWSLVRWRFRCQGSMSPFTLHRRIEDPSKDLLEHPGEESRRTRPLHGFGYTDNPDVVAPAP